jgi:hypothetical protein
MILSKHSSGNVLQLVMQIGQNPKPPNKGLKGSNPLTLQILLLCYFQK